MNTTSLVHYLRRNLGLIAHITRSRLLGRSFAPDPRAHLFIETTGYCNLECRFCAYGKKVRARTTMSQERFEDVVNQGVEMGFSTFYLTPVTGELFTDKGAMDKLAFLETTTGVRSFGFYTNLAAPSTHAVQRLFGLSKLTRLEISVYGEDEEGFVRVTRRGSAQFRRLVSNLNVLADGLATHPLSVSISLRVGRTFRKDHWTGPLAEALGRLEAYPSVRIGFETRYDTWGGLIEEADVAGLDLTLEDGRALYKFGACIMALGSAQVTAAGRVTACACRDAGGRLTLGHLDEAPLSQILSLDNPIYRDLIQDMQAGCFPEVCRSCGLYCSVYDPRWTLGHQAPPHTNLATCFRRMG